MNENENQTKIYDGVETPIDEITKEQEEYKQQQIANSIWKTINPDTTARLIFTGKVYKRQGQYENKIVAKIGFEITEKNNKGQNKLFESGANSTICRELIKRINEAKKESKLPLELFISRSGQGKATAYKIQHFEG